MKEKRVFCILLVLLCTLLLTACNSTEKAKQEFIDKIAEVQENYNKALNASDALGEDVNMKVALGDLRNLANMYEEAVDKAEYNTILDSKLSVAVFQEILEHQADYIAHRNVSDDYILTFKDELVKYYSSK